MKHSSSLVSIAPAIRRAQGKIQYAIKDSRNPFFNSTYANLESCWDAVKDSLQSEGLSVIQTMGFIPGAGPSLITTLLHESGEYITGEQPVCPKGDTPQEVGSAISFARRYGLSAITGLIQVDDDGESSRKATTSPQMPSDERSPPKAPSAPKGDFISPAQLKRLFALAANSGATEQVVKNMAATMGIKSRTEIPKAKYEMLCKLIENYKP